MLFEITDEDRALGTAIAEAAGAADVQTVLAPAEQWTRIVAHMRAAGFAVRPRSESADLLEAYGRVEPRVKQLLARLAPPGTNVTTALINDVKREITNIVIEELKAVGLPDGTAKAMGALMAATLLIKPKTKEASGA